jgi:hypothetical protein
VIQEKSVAVGRRVRDLGSTQRTGGAPDIVNEYRANRGLILSPQGRARAS